MDQKQSSKKDNSGMYRNSLPLFAVITVILFVSALFFPPIGILGILMFEGIGKIQRG